MDIYASDIRKFPEEIEIERCEDVDLIAKVLSSLDIVVKRPQRLERIREINTLDWTNIATPCGNIRDQFLVIGDEIIETAPMMRGRLFENDLVKHLLLDYFKKGAKWTVAPRPRMLENSFDRAYFDATYSEADSDHFEIMFDGAQCLKFGKDILINVSNENHILGATWLQRHLGEKFKIHPVRITDSHLDGSFLPLQPGLLLVHPEMNEKRHLLPKTLRNWDFIQFDDEQKIIANDDLLLLASQSINMNVLSIDERTVMINELAVNTIRNLEKKGITVVPTRLRHSQLYSGAFHCSTLDIRRKDKYEQII
jgi:glycine amidinotransferase